MGNSADTEEKTGGHPLSLAAADAFGRLCKHGDEMLGYGTLMTVSCIAAGLGIQFAWWWLAAPGAVLTWIFGQLFMDARRSHNLARHYDELNVVS